MKKLLIVYSNYEPTGDAIYSLKDPYVILSFKEFFKFLWEKGIEVYITRDPNKFLGNNSYLTDFKYIYEKNDFDLVEETISPNFVWDKTKDTNYPNIDNDKNILNNYQFKAFSENKWQQYLAYREYFSKSFLIYDLREFDKYLKSISTSLFIVKPLNQFGGKGIKLFDKNSYQVEMLPDFPFILQEFSDSSDGIEGICKGKHDLRFVFFGKNLGQIILRTPANGDFKSNWAMGGSFEKIQEDKIPRYILDTIKPIVENISNKFQSPYYSIDLAVCNKRVVLFEFSGSTVSFGDSRWDNIKFYNSFHNRLLEFN